MRGTALDDLARRLGVESGRRRVLGGLCGLALGSLLGLGGPTSPASAACNEPRLGRCQHKCDHDCKRLCKDASPRRRCRRICERACNEECRDKHCD